MVSWYVVGMQYVAIVWYYVEIACCVCLIVLEAFFARVIHGLYVWVLCVLKLNLEVFEDRSRFMA
jgi:hypothetical protein